jgi:hypothetical protein
VAELIGFITVFGVIAMIIYNLAGGVIRIIAFAVLVAVGLIIGTPIFQQIPFSISIAPSPTAVQPGTNQPGTAQSFNTQPNTAQSFNTQPYGTQQYGQSNTAAPTYTARSAPATLPTTPPANTNSSTTTAQSTTSNTTAGQPSSTVQSSYPTIFTYPSPQPAGNSYNNYSAYSGYNQGIRGGW